MFNMLHRLAQDATEPAKAPTANSPELYTAKLYSRMRNGSMFNTIKAMTQFLYMPSVAGSEEKRMDLPSSAREGAHSGFYNEKVVNQVIQLVIRNHFDDVLKAIAVTTTDGGETLLNVKKNIVTINSELELAKAMAALVRRYLEGHKFINDPANPASYKAGQDVEVAYINHTKDEAKLIDANKGLLLESSGNLDIEKFMNVTTFKDFIQLFVSIADTPMFDKVMRLLDARSLSLHYVKGGRIYTEYFAELPILKHIKASFGKFYQVGTYLLDSIVKYAVGEVDPAMTDIVKVKSGLAKFMQKFDEKLFLDYINASAIRTSINPRRVNVSAGPIPKAHKDGDDTDQMDIADVSGEQVENLWADPEFVQQIIEDQGIDKLVVLIVNNTLGLTQDRVAKLINEKIIEDLSARGGEGSIFKKALWDKMQEFIKSNKDAASQIFSAKGDAKAQFTDLYTILWTAALSAAKSGAMMPELVVGVASSNLQEVISSVVETILANVKTQPVKDWGHVRPMLNAAFSSLYLGRVNNVLQDASLIDDKAIELLAKELTAKLPVKLSIPEVADEVIEAVEMRLKATGYGNQVSRVAANLRAYFTAGSGAPRQVLKQKKTVPKTQVPITEPKNKKSRKEE